MRKSRGFTVQGKPFLSLGGQTHNSSSYRAKDLDDAWQAIKLLHGNTVATPIPWDAFESVEGQFNDKLVTDIIDAARAHNIHLVLLWFATWKNATMEYCPSWIKLDPERFQRVICKDGYPIANLSPHCQANFIADNNAFCHLMMLLKVYDSNIQTVIAVQIENEAAYIGTTRCDFGHSGDIEWARNVPEEIIDYAKQNPTSRLNAYWQTAGCKACGTWLDVFGAYGAEGFTTHAIAQYIDTLAKNGKAIYDLFLYANVALDGGSWDIGFGICGYDHFGACANTRNVDIWYACCRYLDAIAPDIYAQDNQRHDEMIELYANPEKGWPLYVPESGSSSINNAQMFYAAANKKCIGYHVFGIESLLGKDGGLSPAGEMTARSIGMLNSVADLVIKYQGTNHLYPIKQYVGMADYLIPLEGWKCKASFVGTGYNWNNMDYRHRADMVIEGTDIMDYTAERGRGLIIQVSENELYIVGHKCRLLFNRYEPLDGSLPGLVVSPILQTNSTFYIETTEGHFEDGKYVIDRVRSGDENRHGIWCNADCGVIHVVLCD